MVRSTKSEKKSSKQSSKPRKHSKSRRKSQTKRSYNRRRSRSRSRRRSRGRSRRNKDDSVHSLHWKDLAPMKKRDREQMKDSCFLDEENKKYPVCAKRVNSVLCKGLNAARSRAILNKNENIVAKADRKKKVLLCGSKQAFERDEKLMLKSLERSSRGNRSRRSRRRRKESNLLKLNEKQPRETNNRHLGSINYSTKYKRSLPSTEDV